MNSLKPVLIEDLNAISSPSSLKYSPDGKTLAFMVVQPDKENNNYKKNLWMMEDGKEATQLTSSGKEGSFLWDDDQTILFVSERNEKKDDLEEKTVFYRIGIHGGEAKEAFSVSKSVSFFQKVTDGIYCMGIEENRNDLPEDADEKRKREEKDYHVIDEVPLWGNGRGFISGVRTGLYLYEEATGELEKLTAPNFDTSSVCVSGKKLLIVGKEWKNVIDETDSLLLYNIEEKALTTLIEQGNLMISRAVFANGKIVLTATDMKPYGDGQYHDIYEYDEIQKKPVKKVFVDCLIGVDILTDCHYSSGESLVVAKEKNAADTIYAIAQHGYKDSIVSYKNSETICTEKTVFNGLVCELAAGKDKLSFAAMEANGCCEIYTYTYADGTVTKKTAFNEAYLASHFVSKAKHMPFVNTDGVTIDGWVLEPKDYDPQKSYPGVLEIHGGPRCAYGEVFFHEMQTWASKGWFVFFCNPRGSEGYGEEFADLRGKYGTIDYQDLMEFTDFVLAAYPQIDKKRIGAAGGSYGGFMCNWIEGHTDRFAALASQRSVSNWVSDFGCSEIGVTFDQNEILATPWTNMEAMWDCSPLKYACNAKTPILFIHSMNDYNCTLDQGIQMFTAVKFYGVPARMCLFEGENHGLSRRGKPLHRMRRLKEMTDWFVHYLN